MINYSIYPGELIFADWDEFEPEFKEIETAGGVKLRVKSLTDEQYQIEQVISTNPQDYLKTEIMPGAVIKTHLQLE